MVTLNNTELDAQDAQVILYLYRTGFHILKGVKGRGKEKESKEKPVHLVQPVNYIYWEARLPTQT